MMNRKIKNYYQKVSDKSTRPVLMVGFNHRFSPHAKKIKELLKNVNGPISMVMTINAGHWIKTIGQ